MSAVPTCGGARRVALMVAVCLVVGWLCAACGVRPSGVISGLPAPTGPAYGVDLYLVDNGQLATALRPTSRPPTPADTLTLLIAGPDRDEHRRGLRTEVPSNVGPVQLISSSSGTTVAMSTNVNALSTMAVSQLVCTAQRALASQGQAPSSTPVTLTGGGNSRGPQGCPLSS